MAASFAAIARREGVASLYRGLGPSICAIIPEAAMTYGLFDMFRSYGAKRFANVNPTVRAVASGVVASLAGMAAAYPIETVARRLQIATASAPGGAALVLREVMANGGPRKLYCGIVPATAKVIPMAVISFFTYDVVQRAISERVPARRPAGGGARRAAADDCCAADCAGEAIDEAAEAEAETW